MKRCLLLGLGLGLCLFTVESQSVTITPHKLVTNRIPITIGGLTNGAALARIQIDAHFKVTNAHDGIVLLSRMPGDPADEWRIEGWRPVKTTNYVVGSQSGQTFLLMLVSKPAQVQNLEKANP